MGREGETNLEDEQTALLLQAVLANAEIARFGVKKCVVIPEGAIRQMEDVKGIISFATASEAFEDNEKDEEAGDDMFAVQFPGQDQKMYSRDDLIGEVRNILDEEGGVE